MAAVAKPLVTEAEYLLLAEASDERLEYVDGLVRAMAGGSVEHGAVIYNVTQALGPLAKRRKCRGFNSDVRVKIREDGRYVYPDLSFACAKAEQQNRSLLNPTLVVEVLSPGTEDYDRGDKRDLYESIPSLQEYLMVHSEEPWVERSRWHGAVWVYESVRGLDATLEVFGGSVPLAELYDGVTFPV